MKSIKISKIWSHEDCKYFLIPKIIEDIYKIKLIWTNPNDCDLLIIGTYRKYGKIKKKLFDKFSFLKNKYFEDYSRRILFRKYKPITIFYSRENERNSYESCDFSIGTDFNYDNSENYLRIPIWKDYCDWSAYGIPLPPLNKLNARRFGQHYSLQKLKLPMNTSFMEKPKKICAFFSYLSQPRDQLIKKMSSYFKISGYGPAFNKNIINHNSSDFMKINIMKNYFSNFCPENELYPGWYTEKVPDSFLGETLPITWADQRIEQDFNKNAFINLNNYNISDLDNLLMELKSNEFLKKFKNEPLITNKLDIDQEIQFSKKILNKLNILNN